MKRSYFLWLFTLCFLTSCMQDEVIYSCDSTVNEWANEHLEEISKMSRDNWLDLQDSEYKMATYLAFTPEQKYLFWKEKISEVLSLDWNADEKEHIQSLESYIEQHKDYFNPETLDEDSFDKYMYLWFEKAKDELNWSSDVLYAMVVSGEIMMDKEGALRTRESVNVMRKRVKSNSECDCSTADDWCMNRVANLPPGSPKVTGTCVSGDCETNKKGCGTFMMKPCNGKCEYKYG